MDTLTRTKSGRSRHRRWFPIPSIVTLAFWRVRETWRLLMVAGLGVLVAVIIICSVPLFSNVSLTAGLRSVLSASPQDAQVSLTATALRFDQHIFTENIDQPLQALVHQELGSYISKPPEFVLQMQGLDVISSDSSTSGDQMTLLGFNTQEAASHAHLLAGQFPQPTSTDLQLAISQKTADSLHMTIGDTIPLGFSTLYTLPQGGTKLVPQTLNAQVTGIFATTTNDLYWQGNAFDPTTLGGGIRYKALMSPSTYLALLTRLGNAFGGDQEGVFFAVGQAPVLAWYYSLNINHISINNLDDLIARFSTTQTRIANSYGQGVYLSNPQISGPALATSSTSSTIERYRDRVDVATVPSSMLALQMLALILFFVSMITNLLVERQASVIALLRSRGASRQQILGSFIIQSLGVGLIALIAGPLLALPTVRLLGQYLLASVDQHALNTLDSNPLQTAWSLHWYALAAAVCSIITMIIAVRGSTSQDVLALRREATRSTRRSLWRRLNLDTIFIIIGLTGFVLSLYVTNSDALDTRSNLLISTPLTLVAPILLVLAGIFLFLRFFPLLLRLAAWLAARRPGAPSMVAIAQMARSPRQATSMILLLALASSFGIFAIIFNASQTQQTINITSHEVGADFSGTIPQSPLAQPSLAKQTAAYRRLPGVTSASLGYSSEAIPSGNNQSLVLQIRAVDTTTYAQTAIWTRQDSSQPLASLMQELAKKSLSSPSPIPAIVDALTWNTLDLSSQATFLVAFPGSSTFLTFVAIDEVQHIPSINDSLVSGGTSDYSPPGGILLDYQTFAKTFQTTTGSAVERNQVWLRTTDDPTALSKLRAALNQGPLALNPVYDRRVMLAQAQSDPLYINLIGVLTLGAATVILLALVGNLIASWLNARSRLTNFAMLRALGGSPAQLASILIFEQSIIYSAAIGLGILFGGLLAATVVPALVFSSIPQAPNITSEEFYVIQRVLPVTVVIPPALLVALALLVLLCMIALGMMARIVSKPSISQTLRLNED